MFNTFLRFSLLRAAYTAVGILLVSYIGLIAVVMTYAASTVAFTQSVRTSEAEVASLEAQYLNLVADITHTDYRAAGYAKPAIQVFVRAENSRAALR